MQLLTKELEEQLIANYFTNQERMEDDGNTVDNMPVVKFFHPMSAATWLISEYNPETGIMFGLCDLGMGFPELGDVSLDELKSVQVHGLGIERDRYWTANKTLMEYAQEAWDAGRIVA